MNEVDEPAAATATRAHDALSHPGIFAALQSLLYVLVISIFLTTFTVQPIRIPSGSMEPTLLVGDFLLLDRQATANDPPWVMPPSGIERGDIIVFHDPVDDPSIHLVKRVIGVPGDQIHLRNGIVYRNGEALPEPYAVHRGLGRDTFRDQFPNLQTVDPGVDAAWWLRLRTLGRTGEITVPADDYFVLGDNRDNSEDSRYLGFVPRKAIVGKPILVYFSLRQPDEDGNAEDGNQKNKASVRQGMAARWDRVAPGKGFARWERTFHVVR